ncbi:MAG TPA: fused MFS/spermidine synthase [Vicinamibacterales bacterium]|nr:fused MFS/spermidine synthase [Vicinamibacterales bacterium]
MILVSALILFFSSGFAALLYQVVWQRTLVIFSGTDVHATTIVVAAFMAGLGCGSVAGGYAADRVSRGVGLLLFAAAELAIAAFGAISVPFFYRFLYMRLGALDLGLGATAAVLFASVVWPTFLMGASLPLMTRALATSVAGAAATVGALYACNTLGAAAGALAATWLFLPLGGIERTVAIAVTVNVACAIAALPIAALLRRQAGPGDRESATEARTAEDASGQVNVRGFAAPWPIRLRQEGMTSPLAKYSILFACSGFLALSFEIVWFRLFGVMLKATAYTFGSVLAVYLLNLGAGAAAGSLFARRARRPAVAFLVLQAAAGLYAVLTLSIFLRQVNSSEALSWFAAYFRGPQIDVRAAARQLAAWTGLANGPATAAWPSDFLRVYGVLPMIFIGPAVAMMGASFPLLQKAVHKNLAQLGRRVGFLLAANIAGSTAGAFLTGWTLLDRLGTAGTLALLATISGGFALLAVRAAGDARPLRVRAIGYAVTALLFGGVAAAVPEGAEIWAALHGATTSTVIAAEDATGVAVLRADQPFAAARSQRVVVFVNGLGQSWIPYGDIHTQLGAVPAFLHPRPRSAAIIGLGSGDTLYAVAGRRDIEHITSIEIIRPQFATLQQLHQIFPYPPLETVTSGPAIEHIFGDGRLYLARTNRRFDIIEADALHPTSAFSGNVYSDTYFSLLRSRLNPGGLAVTWTPTERVARTFVKVFPHAWHVGQILVGSNDPIHVDREAIWQRISARAVQDHFRWGNVDIVEQMRPYLGGPSRHYGPSHDRAGLVDINTDLFPKDEFSFQSER